MAAVNFKSLDSNLYCRQEPPRIFCGREIHRFFLLSPQLARPAAQSLFSFLNENPHLCFVSRPMPPETLEDKVRTARHLVVNGDAVCLSDQPKAPYDADLSCKDAPFSEAWIQEPVQCPRKHTFEKRYIEVWIESKGDVCPYGGHPIGSTNLDPYLSQQVQSIQRVYERQMDIDQSVTEAVQNIEMARDSQNTLLETLRQDKRLSNGCSLMLTCSPEPIAQAFYQIAFPEKKVASHSERDIFLRLTLQQKLQVLKKVASETPLSQLKQIMDRIPDAELNTIVASLGYRAEMNHRLIEKLQILARARQESQRNSFQGPSILEVYETALSWFYPDHNPANPWEAQQMITMLAYGGMMASGISLTVGPAGVALAGAAVGARYVYKRIANDLPTEILPCRNLTLHANAGAFPPLIGRDPIIKQVFHCWAATSATVRQHPLLVGPAGAGKSVIIQEIARQMAFSSNELLFPETLKEGYFFQCIAADLLPGNILEGAEKFERLFQRMRCIQDRVVLAIDEVHTFMNDKYKDRFGDLMKSVLDTSVQGLPYMIFATTRGEYDRYIASNEAMARRLYPIRVDLLDRNHTIAVMHQQIRMQFPGLMFEPQTLDYLFDRSEEMTRRDDRFKQPEISKQVLSRAISKIQTEIAIAPSTKQLNEVKGERSRLEFSLDRSILVSQHDNEILFRIRSLDRDVRELEERVVRESQSLENYKNVIDRIKEGLRFVIELAVNLEGHHRRSFTREEEKVFKFVSYILLPELIATKRTLEEELRIRPLDRSTIDSAIADIEVTLRERVVPVEV